VAGLILGLVLLQDPAALVEQLQDDDIEIRDQATRALQALGEKALPHLNAATLTCRDARLRAAVLVGRIELGLRLAAIKGGEPVAGVRAALRMERDTVKAGEPLTLTLELTNVSDAAINVPAPDRFDLKLPSLESSSSARACIVVTRVPRQLKKELRELEKSCGGGIERMTEPLAPGGSIKKEIVIASGEPSERMHRKRLEDEPAEPIVLPPGEYEVYVVYYAQTRRLLHGAEEDLKSNVVTIKVD